jgi:hypothetical protein
MPSAFRLASSSCTSLPARTSAAARLSSSTFFCDGAIAVSTLTEVDHAAWNSGTTYALADRVILIDDLIVIQDSPRWHKDEVADYFQIRDFRFEDMVEMMAANRSYQNNVEVVNTARQLMMRTLDIIKS